MSILFEKQYYILHIAIFVIATTLIATVIHELRKPAKDPNDNPDTRRMNEMLKE